MTARDWEIHLHFAVHGSGDTLFGDGFAFFYAKDTMEMGKIGFEDGYDSTSDEQEKF